MAPTLAICNSNSDSKSGIHTSIETVDVPASMPQFNGTSSVQVHRSVILNLRAISHVLRGVKVTTNIHLKGGNDLLPVSRNYLHLFGQIGVDQR